MSMKSQKTAAALAGLTLAFAVGGQALAQAPAVPLNAYYADAEHAPLGGYWRPAFGAGPIFMVDGKPLPLHDAKGHQAGFPYKPAWRKVVAARYAADDKGKPYGDPANSCWPAGIFADYLVADPNGMELIQTPGRLEIAFETPSVRWIFYDGREHPTGEDVPYTGKGHSIGHWEGDTLVVDTINVRSEFTFGFNLPHSDKERFTERFKRIDADTLQIDVTFTDPVALTKPVSTTLIYKKADPASIREKLGIEEHWPVKVGPDLVLGPYGKPRKRYGFDLPDPH